MNAHELKLSTHLPARAFYARPTVEVAKDLLGAVLINRTDEGLAAGRIVETEAYLGQADHAAHSAAGRTPRTQVIYGPPGHAYVYRIYGLHHCLNVVAEPDGQPGCVLIRALEPLCGIAAMRQRRATARKVEDIASGPAKLTAAMAIQMGLYGTDLLMGPLTVRLFNRAQRIEVRRSKRIGISRSRDLDLRFFIAHNDFVSRR
ncbi:MAG: DNA-3-methyladenine glycosylase [Bryobacterales bacterium]|nr:DNA-3-methyladenine glycosylase [Bryobacterales bacterium]